jgi:hypothetical protein
VTCRRVRLHRYYDFDGQPGRRPCTSCQISAIFSNASSTPRFCWTRRFAFGDLGTRERTPRVASGFDRVDPRGIAGGDRRFRFILQPCPRPFESFVLPSILPRGAILTVCPGGQRGQFSTRTGRDAGRSRPFIYCHFTSAMSWQSHICLAKASLVFGKGILWPASAGAPQVRGDNRHCGCITCAIATSRRKACAMPPMAKPPKIIPIVIA